MSIISKLTTKGRYILAIAFFLAAGSLAMLAFNYPNLKLFANAGCSQAGINYAGNADDGNWSDENKAEGAPDGDYAKTKQDGDYLIAKNFGFSFSAATIDAIQVDVKGFIDNGNWAYLSAYLSWNGGVSWTATKPLSFSNVAQTLTLSPVDTWGRTWSASEFSNTNFRVKITLNSHDPSNKYAKIDSVGVTVIYDCPTATNTPTETSTQTPTEIATATSTETSLVTATSTAISTETATATQTTTGPVPTIEITVDTMEDLDKHLEGTANYNSDHQNKKQDFQVGIDWGDGSPIEYLGMNPSSPDWGPWNWGNHVQSTAEHTYAIGSQYYVCAGLYDKSNPPVLLVSDCVENIYATWTFTETATATATATFTKTPTETATATATNTPTMTSTSIATATNTPVIPGTLTGFVFSDNNANSLYDAGDAPIAGVAIFAYHDLNSDNFIDTLTEPLVGTLFSLVDGSYTFAGLPAGHYLLFVTAPAGMLPTTGLVIVTDVVPSVTNSGLNFGFTPIVVPATATPVPPTATETATATSTVAAGPATGGEITGPATGGEIGFDWKPWIPWIITGGIILFLIGLGILLWIILWYKKDRVLDIKTLNILIEKDKGHWFRKLLMEKKDFAKINPKATLKAMNVKTIGEKVVKSSQKKNQRTTLIESELTKDSKKELPKVIKELKNESLARAEVLSRQTHIKRIQKEK